MKIFKRQPNYADRSVQNQPNRSLVDAFNEKVIKETMQRYFSSFYENLFIGEYVDKNLVDNRYNKVDWCLSLDSEIFGYAESKTRQNYIFPLWLSMSKAAALLDKRAKHRDDNLRLFFIWGIIGKDDDDSIYYLNLHSPKLNNNRYDLSKCNLVWGGTSKKVKSNADNEWCFEIPQKDLVRVDEAYYVEID
jgi:hypothetical protein